MAGKRPYRNASPIADLTAGVLDPLLQKRAGISVALVQSWEEIAGPDLAARTRPQKVSWPRRLSEDDPFEPATLVLACEGAAALHVQHSAGEVVARVNAFLGFPAVGRIRIVQKPVAPLEKPRPPAPRPLGEKERERLASYVADVEDDGLRAALERLGRSVIGSRA